MPTDPEQDPRRLAAVEAAWNMFDLMPGGGGADWGEQLECDCCH